MVALAGREACFSVMELELIGTRGRLRYGNLGDTIELWHVAGDPMFPGYEVLHRTPDVAQPQMSRYQYHVMDALARHLHGGEPLVSSGDSALGALRICSRVASGLACHELQPIE